MKKNFEGVRAKLRGRASALFPQNIKEQDKYVQGELDKISYYDPKYEKAKEIIEANAVIKYPDSKLVIVIDGEKLNARERYVLDELAKLMAQLPRVEAMKDKFFKEAVLKYPNYKIDSDTGKKVPFEPEDLIIKRMRPVQQGDYVRDHINSFDFWKTVTMPKKLPDLKKENAKLKKENEKLKTDETKDKSEK